MGAVKSVYMYMYIYICISDLQYRRLFPTHVTRVGIGPSMSKEQSRDNAAVAFAVMCLFTRFCSSFFFLSTHTHLRRVNRRGREEGERVVCRVVKVEKRERGK